MQDDPIEKRGNVTLIKGEGKKKPKAESDKIPPALLCRYIADAVKRVTPRVLPPFPRRYGVIEPEFGARMALIVDDDESVTVTRPAALANDILSYTETALASLPEFAMLPKDARAAAEYFLMTSSPIPSGDIAISRWQDEPGLTYRRLPWKRLEGNAPTWEALLSRMSNAYAFIEWVGSLFFEDSYLQNYVWLYGRLGGDGKGAINRFFERVFGTSYASKQSPGSGHSRDKFWTHGLIGKRLIVFPDCDDPVFVTKGLFKSLTGGDPTDVEAKGSMSFTVRLKAKFLIISNEWPALSLSPSDLRRIIYCELGAAESIDPQFEERLWEEGGAFLTACVNRYEAKYPHHGPIATDSELIEGLAATVEEDFDEVFRTWFTVNGTAGVEAHYMLDIVAAEWPRDPKQQHAFRRWLEKRHGVRKARQRTGDDRSRIYAGIELVKVPPERNKRATMGHEQLNKGPYDGPDLS